MSSETSDAAPAKPLATTLQGPKAFTIALAVIVVDQLVKFWILGSVFTDACPGFNPSLTPYTPCSVPVGGPLSLTMVWNQGFSFGLMGGGQSWVRWALSIFSLGVAIALGVWARRVERPILGVAIGLIMGGAVGNLIDRVRLGAVADFLDVQSVRFPGGFEFIWGPSVFPWVFNVADSGITIGVILLLWDSLRRDVKPQ